MKEQLTVRPGPEAYKCAPGILDYLKEYIEDREFKRILVVHGEISWSKVRAQLSGLLEDTSFEELTFSAFQGECSDEEVERLKNQAASERADLIIGVGGGKIMDTVKYVAAQLSGVYSVLIPTLASNCAPWTPLSVMYTPEGEFIRYDFHHRQVSLLLVDPLIIIDAPVRYLAAGLGDTLAKWYESEPNLSLPEHNSTALELAYMTAGLCRKVIETHGLQAVSDAKQNKLSDAFIKAIETIIMTSGLVGGFGDELARTTAAHAIHDGLTFFPETHHLLHGEKVAYGIMVQLALDGKYDEQSAVSLLLSQLGLPVSLNELGLAGGKKLYRKLAALTLEHDPGIHVLPYPVTEDSLAKAIENNELFIEQTASGRGI